MTNDNRDRPAVNIMKASYMLQSRIGGGPLNEEKIKLSQAVIDSNNVDFIPLAEDFLKQLGIVIATVKKDGGRGDTGAALESLCEPVMLLKGNAGMFNYELVTALAGIMLNFLETITAIDEDVVEIVEAHHLTLNHIVRNRMQGNGGQYGTDLQHELKNACKRYFARQASGAAAADNAFFVDI